MAEFKLICPGCSAEYALPPAAIPPEGREVECSDCGHVWHAHPPSPAARLDLAGYAQTPSATASVPSDLPQPALAPASQRLPAAVLDMLRSEVEHERRLREGADPAPPDAAATSQPSPSDDIDWPATTVTAPEPGTAMVPLMAQHRSLPASGPVHPDRPRKPSPERGAEQATVIRHPVPPAADPMPQAPYPPATVPVANPPRAAARGYGAGLTLMLLIAAAIVAFYVLAPGRVPEGSLPAQWHDMLTDARHWLNQRLTR